MSAFACFRQIGLPGRAGLLGLVAVLVGAMVAPVAGLLHGWHGVLAAAIAGLVCLAGATTALLVSELLRGSQYAVLSLLLGMAARLSAPLVLALVCRLQGGVLDERSILVCLLIFYPVTLAVETALALPSSQDQRPGKAPGQAVV
jgi:hypothetical protein